MQDTEAAAAQAKLAALQAQVESQQGQPDSVNSADAEQMRDATRRVLLAQVDCLLCLVKCKSGGKSKSVLNLQKMLQTVDYSV